MAGPRLPRRKSWYRFWVWVVSAAFFGLLVLVHAARIGKGDVAPTQSAQCLEGPLKTRKHARSQSMPEAAHEEAFRRRRACGWVVTSRGPHNARSPRFVTTKDAISPPSAVVTGALPTHTSSCHSVTTNVSRSACQSSIRSARGVGSSIRAGGPFEPRSPALASMR